METKSVGPRKTMAAAARRRVEAAEPGSFLRRKDFEGTDRAVETALSRLVAAGDLMRVRRGLYWKGRPTRFGMTSPSTLEAALAVAGPGAGPTGVAAALLLGLTTQVPGVIEVAVPGKAPEPYPGVRFRTRPYGRREHHMSPTEVAALEVLRDPRSAEASWADVGGVVRGLVASHAIRAEAFSEVVCAEHHPAARERWSSLVGAS